jgi:hypothetical protein
MHVLMHAMAPLSPVKLSHHKHHVAMETEAPTGHTKASYFAEVHVLELGDQETALPGSCE